MTYRDCPKWRASSQTSVPLWGSWFIQDDKSKKVWCPITGSELSVGRGLTININKIHGHFSRSSQPITLGARDFSSAISGFCQVFKVTRAKWLRRSWLRPMAEDVSAFGQHRKFLPHARKTYGTQGSSLFEEVSKTRKKVSSHVKKPRSRWRLVLQPPSRVQRSKGKFAR